MAYASRIDEIRGYAEIERDLKAGSSGSRSSSRRSSSSTTCSSSTTTTKTTTTTHNIKRKS